jgi:branched-chain amino acid aminotransferase
MGIRINVDGRIGTDDDRMLSPLDLGFIFGASVYETLRTYSRRPFLLTRHLKRLRESADSLNIPIGLSDEAFTSRVEETIVSANNRESTIRIIVSEGIGQIDYGLGAAAEPTIVIIVKPLPEDWERSPEQVMRVALVEVVRNPPRSVNPRIKSSNLLNNLLAMRAARSRGAEEALMLNYLGELAEGSLTNVFIVKDGVVKTPSLETGILGGITREIVIGLAKEKGIEAEETTILPDQLLQADEVFLTGTTKEVIPVVAVNDCIIGDGKAGPITMTLWDAYREKVHEFLEQS